MSVYSKLLKIQNELKAPKNQFNNFGKYKYRNCEDILEALKPILQKERATIIISDEIVEVNGRNYIKSVATLTDVDDNKSVNVSAFAREEENKKGMDSCQATGCASSYARKYALNGLFAIDDTKDSDSIETEKNINTTNNIINLKKQFKDLVELYSLRKNVPTSKVKDVIQKGINIDFENLDDKKIQKMINFLSKELDSE